MPCTGYCVTRFIGFDGTYYWYWALDCTQPSPQPTVQISLQAPINNPLSKLDTCETCHNCISVDMVKEHMATRAANSTGFRPVYRKDVQHPGNPLNKPDAFLPAPNSAVIAEYTIAYQVEGHHHLARLYEVASVDDPGLVMRGGWRLDHHSPPSPTFVAHFVEAHLLSVTIQGNLHVLRVAGRGDFRVVVA